MPAALLAVALLAVCSLPSGARAHATFNERVEAAAEQISIAPGMAQPYLQRAGVYHAHGDWDAALADIEQARRIEPARADLGFLRGRILVSAGRFADAEAALTRYLALRPDDPRARAERARARVARGRWLVAASDYTVAIESSAEPRPGDYLARARALAAAGRRADAVRGLDDGVVRLGPLAVFAREAAKLEVASGRIDDALARLERMAARAPRRGPWLARRAEILRRAGRSAEARTSLRLALADLQALPAARRDAPALRDAASDLRARLTRLSEADR